MHRPVLLALTLAMTPLLVPVASADRIVFFYVAMSQDVVGDHEILGNCIEGDVPPGTGTVHPGDCATILCSAIGDVVNVAPPLLCPLA